MKLQNKILWDCQIKPKEIVQTSYKFLIKKLLLSLSAKSYKPF